jgi:hypothetical protein
MDQTVAPLHRGRECLRLLADIAPHDAASQVIQEARVGPGAEEADHLMAPLHEGVGQMRPQESAGTCDEDAHRNPPTGLKALGGRPRRCPARYS